MFEIVLRMLCEWWILWLVQLQQLPKQHRKRGGQERDHSQRLRKKLECF